MEADKKTNRSSIQAGSRWKLWTFLLLILIVVGLNYKFGWTAYLGNMENLMLLKPAVALNLPLALTLYVGLTVVGCVVLALPGATFALLAGILFGPWLGTVACLVATTVGAALAFLVGRFFLKESLQPMLEKQPALKKMLFTQNKTNETLVLMVTRMVPLFPYNLQNFAYGITEIGFWRYTWLTLVFMLPGVAFFTIGAAGLTAGENRMEYFLIAGVLAVAVTVAGLYLKKKYVPTEA